MLARVCSAGFCPAKKGFTRSNMAPTKMRPEILETGESGLLRLGMAGIVLERFKYT